MSIDYIWPYLEKGSETTPEDQEKETISKINEINKKIDKIKTANSNRNFISSILLGSNNDNDDFLLEEARRLYDHELSRKQATDNKGGIYIAATLAFMSLLIALFPLILSYNSNTEAKVLSYFLFILSLVNIFRALLWARKALSVSEIYTLHVDDLFSCQDEEKPSLELTKVILHATLKNYNKVNEKVTSIKMTEVLLRNAAIYFISLLILNHLFYAIIKVGEQLEYFVN